MKGEKLTWPSIGYRHVAHYPQLRDDNSHSALTTFTVAKKTIVQAKKRQRNKGQRILPKSWMPDVFSKTEFLQEKSDVIENDDSEKRYNDVRGSDKKAQASKDNSVWLLKISQLCSGGLVFAEVFCNRPISFTCNTLSSYKKQRLPEDFFCG